MSIETAHYVNMFLGLGVIGLFILAVVALFLLVLKIKNKYLAFIQDNFSAIDFLISFFAVLSSLFFTKVLHWVPCVYCWWDRVWIFPQAVIYGAAWVKKESASFSALAVLTVFGLINSIGHIYIYYWGEGSAPCDPSGVSCVQRLVNEFGGFISIPSMAFVGFFSLATLLLVVRLYKRDGNQ